MSTLMNPDTNWRWLGVRGCGRTPPGFGGLLARVACSRARFASLQLALLFCGALSVVQQGNAQVVQNGFDPSGNLVQRTTATPAAPQILGQPQNQIVQPGYLASFGVLLADSSGCVYQWQFYGTNLAGANGDALLLRNVTTNNQGPYSVIVTNNFGSVTSVVAQLWIDSRGCGMPDSWQLAYFGNLNQNALGDFDGDGVPNLQEFQDGTNPTNRTSFRSRLTVFNDGGLVSVVPEQTSYAVTDTVTLTGTALSPNAFFGWSGDLVTRSNPASLAMNTNKTVRACFLCQPAVSGLVGWWRGEGDASDLVGNHNGTFYSGTTNLLGPSIITAGMVGSAFVFYGTNYIQVADSNDLRQAQFTLEAWVNPTAQTANYQTVVARGSAVNDDDAYYLGVINGTASFWTKNNGGMYQLSGGSVPANQWTHLVATFDGATKRLYVNGMLVGTQGGLGVMTYDPQVIPLTIGSDWTVNAPAYLFTGMLDEVSLFNRALSVVEVTGLYIASVAGKCTNRPIFTSSPLFATATQGTAYTQQVSTVLGTLPVTFSLSAGALPAGLSLSPAGQVSGVPTVAGSNVFAVLATDAAGLSTELVCGLQVLGVPPQVPAMPAGIVSWWRAENNALDSIGTNNGTLSNGVSFATGEVGNAFAFSGVTTQQVRIPASASLNVGTGNGMTIEGWIRPATLTNQLPLAEWNDGSTWGSHFWINVFTGGQGGPGCLYANLRDVNLADHSFASPVNLLSTSVWQHVALTYDSSSGIAQMFLNGTVVAYAGLGVFVPRTSPTLYLGFRPGQASYSGLLDEFALYNRGLSTNEVASIYYAGPLGKISSGPYINTLSNLPDAVVNTGYTQSIVAASAAGPVTYVVSGGNLPPGLVLSTSGVVSGIPTSVGSYSFSLTATDTNNLSNSGSFSLAVYAPVAPPAGLMGWWRGESNAVDQLGFHNGTLQGNATYGPGRVGTGFKLDGNNSYVDLGPWSAGSNWTLEAWIKPTALPGGRRTIFGTMANCYDWGLVMNNGQLGAQIRPPGGCSSFIPSGVIPAINSWYHLVETCDGYTAAVYVNGVLGGTLPVQPNYIGDPSGLRIGSAFCCGEYFPGSIDEVAIYNRPLTAAEVAGLYAAGAGGKTAVGPYFATSPILPPGVLGQTYTQSLAVLRATGPVTFAVTGGTLAPGLNLSSAGVLSGKPTGTGNFSFMVTATDGSSLSGSQTFGLPVLTAASPAAGVVSWWRAETNALDSIGSNNGFLINSATYAPGKVGQAFSFNGVSDAVEFLDSPSLRPASLTLECWVMFLSGGGTQSIIAKTYGNGTADSYVVWLQNGYLYGGTCDISGNGSPIGVPFSPYAGQWYHVAFTFDDTTKQQILYLNGTAVAFGVVNISIGYDNHPVYLGADVNNNGLGLLMQGRIDEAAIYNRALSPAEIAALYGADAAGKTAAGPYFTTLPSLPDAAYGLGYAQSITTARGTPTVTYALTGGALPPGLTLTPSGLVNGVPTNVLAVVPTNAVTYAFTVTATDATSLSASQNFSVRVTPAVPPPAGLISWWRAENNALDSAGTNNGIPLNATLYAPGEVGQAFSFDGFSSYVFIPDSPSLRPRSVTLETWVRFDSSPGTEVIFTKPVGTTTLDSYVIWVEGGYLKGEISNINGHGPVLAAPFSPTVGQWNHVAFTFDDLSRQQVLYLNNTTVASGLSDRWISYDTNGVMLGCDNYNGSRAWFVQGRVDEAAVYSRALTATEITSLYYAGVAGKTTTGPYFRTSPPLPDAILNQPYSQPLLFARGTGPVAYKVMTGVTPPGLTLSSAGVLGGTPTAAGSFQFTARVTDANGLFADQFYTVNVYAPVVAPSGLIGWWRGESNTVDQIGTHNGTSQGNATYGPGKVGTAFNLDGINSYIDLGAWSAGSNWTLEAWVSPSSFPGGRVTVFGSLNNCLDWGLEMTGGQLGMQIRQPGGCTFFLGSGVYPSPGDWYHVAGTSDGTNASYYVNGLLAGTYPVDANYVGNATGLRIGSSVCCGEYFPGMVDEVSIYNRPLSAQEIASIYNAGPAGKILAAPILINAGLLNNSLVLSFSSIAGKTYTVEYKDTLPGGTWTTATTLVASGPTLSYTNDVTSPLQRFFRVRTTAN